MGKLFNLIIFIYLLIILILSWMGPIAYGHGLGDMIYASGLILIVIIHLIIILNISKIEEQTKKDIYLGIVGVIFLIVAILYTIKFTIGRGPEYSWKGQIFHP